MALNRCFPVIIVILAQYIFHSTAVQCYKCMFAPYVYFTNRTTLLCEDFDYSDKFIVDCPYSTLCVKKNTFAHIKGGINGTERDCAAQRLDTQTLSNGKWHAETKVLEPYSEGCKSNEDKGFRTAQVEHCYCRGDLCNTGTRLSSEFGTIFMLSSVLIVTVLYIF